MQRVYCDQNYEKDCESNFHQRYNVKIEANLFNHSFPQFLLEKKLKRQTTALVNLYYPHSCYG